MNWGYQRILCCVNSVSGMDGSAARSTTPNTRPQREGKAAYSSTNSLPNSPDGFKEKEVEGTTMGALKEKDVEQKNASFFIAYGPTIPWNLRKQKATHFAPQEKGWKHYRCSSPSEPAFGKDDSRKANMRGTVIGENSRQRKFCISLSRKEIEEDFYGFKGTKPNGRTKKRPKVVQKELDASRNFIFKADNFLLDVILIVFGID
ncbi:hypothetical protein M5K25_012910 [Dendrobium thyrsiflorum]|uniref:Uncharacterized protein n=1 Tax=Dendrobium thyrsiflorum TaxID=117978 RepID=A0ABD0V5K3_DENTH